jgi:hypothetical protein
MGEFVFLGIPFTDAKSARLMRVVMAISTLMMVLALASFILQVAASFYAVWIGLVSAIFIPLCGYYGAKHRSRTLISCFTIWNLVELIFFIIAVTTSWDTADSPTSSSSRDNRGVVWAAFGLAIAMAVLQLFGFIFGAKLLRAPYFAKPAAVPVAQPVMGVTGPQPVQPVVAGYPAYVVGSGYPVGGASGYPAAGPTVAVGPHAGYPAAAGGGVPMMPVPGSYPPQQQYPPPAQQKPQGGGMSNVAVAQSSSQQPLSNVAIGQHAPGAVPAPAGAPPAARGMSTQQSGLSDPRDEKS